MSFTHTITETLPQVFSIPIRPPRAHYTATLTLRGANPNRQLTHPLPERLPCKKRRIYLYTACNCAYLGPKNCHCPASHVNHQLRRVRKVLTESSVSSATDPSSNQTVSSDFTYDATLFSLTLIHHECPECVEFTYEFLLELATELYNDALMECEEGGERNYEDESVAELERDMFEAELRYRQGVANAYKDSPVIWKRLTKIGCF